MQISIRKCKKCGIEKPLDGFWKHNAGHRHECKDCMRSRMRKWETDNPERKNANAKKSYLKLKIDPVWWEKKKASRRVGNGNTYADRVRDNVYKAYGGAICACCGEENKLFLTMDHINNDGHIHRKKDRVSNLYNWLKARGYPEGFQVLCFNCNLGKARNKGMCPHKSRQEGPETIAQASTLK